MMNELKPCPFCEGVNLNLNCDDKRLMCDTVECNGCGALVPSAEWNDRTDGWIIVDSAEDLPIGQEVLCWDGCEFSIDYADMDSDSGTNYMANGTEVEAYKLLCPPKAVK